MNLNHDTSKIDQEIDAALKMLGEVEPPTEMASRIHRKLEATGSVPGRNRRRLFWIPATCAVAAAVLLVLFLPSHGLRDQQAPTTENAKLEIEPSVPPLPASAQPGIVTPKGNNDARVVSKAVRISHRRQHPEYRHAKNLLNYPLTEQEKLLVQFAQTAKPEDLRYLNPEYQARMEAQQKAEFTAYLKSNSIFKTHGTED